MQVRMQLLSDVIFGSGMSIPGGEDISVQHDEEGFPYYRGGTFKGVFREEMENYLFLCGKSQSEVERETNELFGLGGEDRDNPRKLVFSDFVLPDIVKETVLLETGGNPDEVLSSFTHLRTFTRLNEDGTVAEGSLRSARCVNRDLVFRSTITVRPEDEQLIREVLPFVKWIGTQRNRGFGQVRVYAEEEA